MKQINLNKDGLNQDCIILTLSLITYQRKEWSSEEDYQQLKKITTKSTSLGQAPTIKAEDLP